MTTLELFEFLLISMISLFMAGLSAQVITLDYTVENFTVKPNFNDTLNMHTPRQPFIETMKQAAKTRPTFRQVEISKWFGELDDVIIKHPKQVHPSVFRISNDASEGVTGAGRGGWHVDGNYHESPNAFSIYHIVSTSSTGDTVFAPLTKLLENLPQEQYDRWDRLWMKSSKKPGYIHPLIYTYPISHKKVMCFNLAWTESFIWDYGTSQERQTENNETKAILKEIEHEFVKDNGAIQYSHKWEPGDFMVTDNPALGHIASPGTQDSPEHVGLRILHRTTIKGLKRPSK